MRDVLLGAVSGGSLCAARMFHEREGRPGSGGWVEASWRARRENFTSRSQRSSTKKLGRMHAKPGEKKEKRPDDAPHVDSEETKLYRKLVKLEPEDIQARIYLAESLRDGFDKKGDPHAGTAEAQRILQEILKQHPDDTAANHYWIHALEPRDHPELALESAKKLGGLTSRIRAHGAYAGAHLLSHGRLRVGAGFVLDSMRVDETYMRTQQVTVANDWNYVHNLMYLIADLMEAGRVGEAMKISEKLTKARGEVGPTLYRQTPGMVCRDWMLGSPSICEQERGRVRRGRSIRVRRTLR